ncbi:nucleotidyltransferase domain-containing protein [Pedobacter jamesrossensis]|uniref:Nucleotidyltransferase domain-containing protein n=1 Tax=Pedobacter jamesrossensis TaxID=1908238 RepID=A0ABV8NLX9_9SPHI
MITNLNKKLLTFVKEKFPDVYVAFLTGSRVDGYASDESDYDIYLLTYTRDYVFSELFMWEGKKIQLVHIPVSKVDEILWYDWFVRTGIHIGCFAKGLILLDNGEYLMDLINECKKLYIEGPRRCTYSELNLYKVNIMNLVSDLSGNNRGEEKMMLGQELYKTFIQYYLESNLRWVNNHKHLARQMNLFNPSLSTKLLNEFRNFSNSLDPCALLDLIRVELVPLGRLDNGYSRYSGLIELKSDYLIINLLATQDFFKVYEWIQNSFQLLSKDIISHFVFRSRPLGDDSSSGETLYLVLQLDRQNFAKPLISKIEGIFNAQPNRIRPHYPVNIDFSLIFGGEGLVVPFFKFFSTITKKYGKDLKNESNSIFYALIIVKKIKDVFFESENKWIDFTEMIEASWISSAYDNKRIHLFDQIVKAKKNIYSVFFQQFAEQKEILSEIFLAHSSNKDYFLIEEQLKELEKLLKLNYEIKPHQMCIPEAKRVEPHWIVLKSLLDYSLRILLFNESQKSYLIYVITHLSVVAV